jgi:hypothetical protein
MNKKAFDFVMNKCMQTGFPNHKIAEDCVMYALGDKYVGTIYIVLLSLQKSKLDPRFIKKASELLGHHLKILDYNARTFGKSRM